MPEKVFLSDILKSVKHIDFEFVQRGAEQNATSKAGKPYSFWEYTVKSRSTGQQSVERLMKFDHLKMDRIQPGQLMRASLNDKGYVTWDAPPAGEAALAEPNNNFKEVKAEREYSAAVQDRNEERELKDIQICLQGFAQAFIASGSCGPDLPVAGMITASLDFAAQAREALLKKSREVHLGIPSVPQQDTSSLPF